MELIIFIGFIIFIAWFIGHNSSGKDYDSAKYHKDWNKEYNKWKWRGKNDKEAAYRSFAEVQKNKKDGKYDK